MHPFAITDWDLNLKEKNYDQLFMDLELLLLLVVKCWQVTSIEKQKRKLKISLCKAKIIKHIGKGMEISIMIY